MAVTKTFSIFQLANIEEQENGTDYDYWNTSDILASSCKDEKQSLQIHTTLFQPLLYSLIFLLGVVGNGLMISVLLRRRHILRITEIYLLHLALSDLMLLVILPFNLAEYISGWLFGDFLCKMMGLLRNLNLFCGSFLLACIGFDRYLAIVHAIPSMRNRRPRTVHVICSILWLVCLGLSVPNIVFLAVKEDSNNTSSLTCYYYHHDIHGHNWVLTNRVFGHVCFFLCLGVMSYCYTAVVVTLCKSQKSQTKQGAIRLALLVTLVFCFCWLPYNITSLIQTMVDLEVITYESCRAYVLLHIAIDVTDSLGLAHCCLNPFLYAFVGVQFRKELTQLLCKLCCSPACLPLIRNNRRPSISDGVTTTSML